VASNDSAIKGVISLRGGIVPVEDLADRLGVSVSATDHAKIIIIEATGGTAGITVDAVEEVLRIHDDQLDTTSIAHNELMNGIVKIDDRLIVLLDAESLHTTIP
jgi:purine-binding chemotaxis protein CheW